MYQSHKSLTHFCGQGQVTHQIWVFFYSCVLLITTMIKAWCAPVSVHQSVCTSQCAPVSVHQSVCTSQCAPVSVHQSVCIGEPNLLLSMVMLACCTGICPTAAALDHDVGCCIWADCVAVDADFAPCPLSKCSRHSFLLL